jgi:hypothetical protein
MRAEQPGKNHPPAVVIRPFQERVKRSLRITVMFKILIRQLSAGIIYFQEFASGVNTSPHWSTTLRYIAAYWLRFQKTNPDVNVKRFLLNLIRPGPGIFNLKELCCAYFLDFIGQ